MERAQAIVVGAIPGHPTVLGSITKQAEQATSLKKKKKKSQSSALLRGLYISSCLREPCCPESQITPPLPSCCLWAQCFITAVTRIQCHLYKIPSTLAKGHAQKKGGGVLASQKTKKRGKKLSTFAEQALCHGSDLSEDH